MYRESWEKIVILVLLWVYYMVLGEQNLTTLRKRQKFQLFRDNSDSPVADPAAGLGGEKHEIYAAAFGGHLFYDLILQGWGTTMGPSANRIR